MIDIVEMIAGDMFYKKGVAEPCKNCGEVQVQCLDDLKARKFSPNSIPTTPKFTAMCSECGVKSRTDKSPRNALVRWNLQNLVILPTIKNDTLGILESLDEELSKDSVPEHIKLGQRPYCMKCRTWLLPTGDNKWQCQTCDGIVTFDSEMAGYQIIPEVENKIADEWGDGWS